MSDEVGSEKVRALRSDQPTPDATERQFIETMAEFLPKPHLGKCQGFVMVAFYEKGESEFWHIDAADPQIPHKIAFAAAVLSNRAVIGQDAR